MTATAPAPAFVNPPAARTTLRSFGAGPGLLTRLGDEGACLVAAAVVGRAGGDPGEGHFEALAAEAASYLDWRAGQAADPLTVDRAASLIGDAWRCYRAAKARYDEVFDEYESAGQASLGRAEDGPDGGLIPWSEELRHADADLTWARIRLDQAIWDWCYLARPADFWTLLEKGSPAQQACARAAAGRMEDPAYPGAAGACGMTGDGK